MTILLYSTDRKIYFIVRGKGIFHLMVKQFQA